MVILLVVLGAIIIYLAYTIFRFVACTHEVFKAIEKYENRKFKESLKRTQETRRIKSNDRIEQE